MGSACVGEGDGVGMVLGGMKVMGCMLSRYIFVVGSEDDWIIGAVLF